MKSNSKRNSFYTKPYYTIDLKNSRVQKNYTISHFVTWIIILSIILAITIHATVCLNISEMGVLVIVSGIGILIMIIGLIIQLFRNSKKS